MEPLATTGSWTKVIIWLPALVLGIGMVAAVMILLGRAFMASVREWGHPRLIAAGAIGLVAVVVLLTYLGVSLPRE
jgi:hypothetical protein